MSALPPKADIGPSASDVCFVPIADSCNAAKALLFDHLIGATKQALTFHCALPRILVLRIKVASP
jgi:hypothetical protein